MDIEDSLNNESEDIDVVSCDFQGTTKRQYQSETNLELEASKSQHENEVEDPVAPDIEDSEDAALENENSLNELHTDNIDSPVPETSSSAGTKPAEKVKLVRLPLSKIKNMMKMDPDCNIISQEAVFAVTKATELFLDFMSKEIIKHVSGTKRKTILKKDVDCVVDGFPHLCFLDGVYD